MTALATQRLFPDAAGLRAAAAILRQGGLVAFPTETVYGLGADARNGAAVAAVYAAKGRPAFNPLIVHVTDLDAVRRLCIVHDQAACLARAFWPGALTMVLPLRPDHGIAGLVTAGQTTLAVRVPDHPVAQALLAACDAPVAAPSANPSGRISPTTATHVLAGLAGRIAAVLDGGACGLGLESTIIGWQPEPVLLRAGGLPVEEIEAVLGQRLGQPAAGSGPTAPGQLASHYAPSGQVRLNATTVRPGEILLGFGPGPATLNLSDRGDLTEAAANLFGHLHRLDALGATHIAVAPIPDTGLGRAINDRLQRAAAPRP